MKTIALLGSTGSIGQNTLRVVRHLRSELCIGSLAVRSNLDLLEQQVREFSPKLVAIFDKNKALEFQRRHPNLEVLAGEEGLIAAASLDEVDFTMLAMSGSSGLKPACAAIERGKTIGLANKEILVSAGELIMRKAKEFNVPVLPVDSEHSALFQCLKGNEKKSVRRLILTASGGPFREKSEEMLQQVTLQDALRHPNWSMGEKITIDSSTLMNKGLELIEAKWLFEVAPEQIDVIVHPQSVIHSCVEFCDGSILAQMAEHDMALPIQYALTYPNRRLGLTPPFDFLKHSNLTFEAPNRKKFPCLRLAEEALRLGRSYPCALNAANEILVERFLNKEFAWSQIGIKLEQLMSSHSASDMLTLDSVIAVDQESRSFARRF